MNRAELRRNRRLFGWRGAKAQRPKPIDPEILFNLRLAVNERIEREKSVNNDNDNDNNNKGVGENDIRSS